MIEELKDIHLALKARREPARFMWDRQTWRQWLRTAAGIEEPMHPSDYDREEWLRSEMTAHSYWQGRRHGVADGIQLSLRLTLWLAGLSALAWALVG